MGLHFQGTAFSSAICECWSINVHDLCFWGWTPEWMMNTWSQTLIFNLNMWPHALQCGIEMKVMTSDCKTHAPLLFMAFWHVLDLEPTLVCKKPWMLQGKLKCNTSWPQAYNQGGLMKLQLNAILKQACLEPKDLLRIGPGLDNQQVKGGDNWQRSSWRNGPKGSCVAKL